MIRVALLLAVSMATASTTDLEVSPIKTRLLPLHLGKSRIVQSKHSFIHYVEIKPLIELLTNIKSYSSTVERILSGPSTVKTSTQQTHRNILTNLLTHTHYLIQETEIKLENLKPHVRHKRGLINIVGKTSKWLFGTLDSEDAERYDKAVQTLSINQESLAKEVKLQTSLIKSLITNYNNTITILSKNQKLIESRLNYFETNVQKTFDEISAFLRTQNTLDQIILNCQNLITFLDNLEDAVMFASLNTVHNMVVSTTELLKIVDKLTKLYGKDHIIKFKNAFSYYQLASLSVSFTANKIIFALQLPLLDSQEFDYFHLYPIPRSNYTLIPPHPYLMLSSSSHQYDDEECRKIEDTYICQNKLVPNDEDCITQLIQKTNASRCQLVPIRMKQPLIEQISKNYILVIPHDQPVKAKKICNSNGFLAIDQASLVKLPEGCQMLMNNNIFSTKENLLNGEPFSLPEVNFINMPIYNKTNTLIHVDDVNLDSIAQLHKQASLLQPSITPAPIPVHHITSMFVIILIVLAVVVIYFIIRKLRYHGFILLKKKRQDPAPAENNTSVLFSNLRREELHV